MLCVYLVGLLGLLATSCIGDNGGADRSSGKDASAALYAACDSHRDCQGTGLLCDARRGCVECLEPADCVADETCRLGLCASGEQEPSDARGDAGAEGTAVGSSTDEMSNGEAQGGETNATGAVASPEATDGDGNDDRTDDGPAGETSEATNGEAVDPTDDATFAGTNMADIDAGNPTTSGGSNVSSGQCVMRLAATFRDFPASHPDFGEHECSEVAQGVVARELDADGRPTLSGQEPSLACMSSSQNFSQWYRDGDHNHRVTRDLVLFDDGRGGFVNRHGAGGEPFAWPGGPNEESYPGGDTLAECESSCRTYVTNESFNAGCGNFCNPQLGAVQQVRARLAELEAALVDPDLLANDAGVAPTVGEIEEEIAELEVALVAREAEQQACMTTCENGVDSAAAECSRTCLPCSYGAGYCTGGELIEYDGTPLFFPLDDVSGPSADFDRAKMPDAYGLFGWPWEDEVFVGAPEHNFYFTSEVHATLELGVGSIAQLEFLGDDDLWVFINGRLALDVGGVHVPAGGTVTIQTGSGLVETSVWVTELEELLPVSEASYSLSDFELQAGGTYTVSIFHAERQKEGSSFRLRLTGFDESNVECD